MNILPTAELQAWLALIRTDGVGPATGGRLLEMFGSPSAVLDAGRAGWRRAGLNEALQEALGQPDRGGVALDLQWLAAPGRHLVTFLDPRYPAALRDIPQPPLALFCQGDPQLLALPQIAIVGSRQGTPQGLENARAFGAELARRGLVVTSGLALGIDGAAHRGALSAQGSTIGVCATGLDRIYPARHRELAHEIARTGLLVSEFPAGVAAVADNFPRRNRVISGLSLGVLVVEAARESGSLITARYANEQGRDVFAIPGSIHNPLARGCHALIRQGAKLVETVDDILVELAPQIGARLREAQPGAGVARGALLPLQELILEALDDAPVAIDTLVERTGAPVQELSAALLALELSGHVASSAGGAYQRVLRM
ncbi:MAG TPA: DNA-processing protein DprA [Solimonas sp.]|nr:DNA-processing protein DprA [Solimonas sp.]